MVGAGVGYVIFTGHEYDMDTGLNYFGARYQDGTRGQFLSQDPAFLAVGDTNELKKQTKFDQVGYLSNPQNLNSYSYATNNPLTKVDQNGKFAFLIPAAIYIADTAPIWVPAAITGVSAIGATVATWHWGQEVGYLSAGDYKAADKSSSAVENTLTATLGGVGGVMEAASLFSPFASQESQAGVTINKPYSRPPGATNDALRQSVQGKSCATCGATAPVMYADHKTPLVQEYYETGKIDTVRMHNVNAVQPQCPSCSNRQGGIMSNYSKQMKVKFGL